MSAPPDNGAYVKQVADALRPALNIYDNGLMRVSHGDDDIAETVVRLVLREMKTAGWAVFLPEGSARFTG